MTAPHENPSAPQETQPAENGAQEPERAQPAEEQKVAPRPSVDTVNQWLFNPSAPWSSESAIKGDGRAIGVTEGAASEGN
jgi:hypothetical protein